MRYWSIVLHFYQPPTQELKTTKTILEFCYLPLLRMLAKKSGFGLTINISGSLLAQLHQLGSDDFFGLVKQLIDEKKVEIVTSVMYHPLMPLTPKDVLIRQIKKNNHIVKDLLGVEKIDGFFPPELAVDTASLDLLSSKYIIIDETALHVNASQQESLIKYGEKYLLVNNREVCELMRAYPKQLSAARVVAKAHKNLAEETLVVIANDAELFGHHYSERLEVLADLLDRKDITFITSSEAVSRFSKNASLVSGSDISASTWQNGHGFNLWTHNKLQKKYLKLLNSVYALTAKSSNESANDFFDQANSSCYLYWLSNWPWWHPDLVESGAIQLIRAVRSLSTANEDKIRIEKMYYSFLQEMWSYHWSGAVESKYKERDEKLFAIKNKSKHKIV